MTKIILEPCAHSLMEANPNNVAGSFAEISIAISLKRLADMVEEDRKPRIEIAPEGWVSDQEHRRILREGLERDGQTWLRIASAIEAIAANDPPLPARSGPRRANRAIAAPIHDSGCDVSGERPRELSADAGDG